MRPNSWLSPVLGSRRAGLVLTVALGAAACGNGPDTLAPSPRPTGVVVSEPLAITAATPPAVIRASVQQLAPGANGVAYVSMQPGTFAGRSAALITNRRIGQPVQVAFVNGGLDPFPIPAAAGDTLQIVIAASGSQPSVTLVYVVPTALQPYVVRTQPAPGIRDVALLDVIQIVFTEPMNAATINGTTISLSQNGAAGVAGQVGLSPDGLTATFRPNAALAPNTQYVLTVGADVAGFDGLRLGTPVTVTFTTGTVSGAAVALTFTVQPVGALPGQVMAPPVRVMATDASGNQATSFTGNITVAIGSNPGGGSLSGTTTRAGFAIFDDLRIDRVGNGYTLVATASGLPPATSAPFDIATALAATDRIALHAYSHGIVLIQSASGGTAPLVEYLGPGFWADEPAWSPDGTKLAFVSDTGIHVMNADGSAVQSLNQPGFEPAWSPDGSKIAFTRCVNPPCGIYVMSANGSNVVRLTNDSTDHEPAWSPDGTKIAFARGARPDSIAIYVMNADGSGVARLTQAGDDPAWSPDGTRIASSRFVWTTATTEGFRVDIWVMNADGSGQTNLTRQHGQEVNYHPTWSPDGRRIAFASSSLVMPYQIFVMNADGSGIAFLGGSADGYASFNPAWAPR